MADTQITNVQLQITTDLAAYRLSYGEDAEEVIRSHVEETVREAVAEVLARGAVESSTVTSATAVTIARSTTIVRL